MEEIHVARIRSNVFTYIDMIALNSTLNMRLANAMKMFVQNTIDAMIGRETCDHNHDQLIDLVQHLISVLFTGLLTEQFRIDTGFTFTEVQIVALIHERDILPIFDQCVILFQGAKSQTSARCFTFPCSWSFVQLLGHNIVTEFLQIVLFHDYPHFFQFQSFVDRKRDVLVRVQLIGGFDCRRRSDRWCTSHGFQNRDWLRSIRG